jgi:1-pyrroline-5-carboxylate dehydrogenase
MKHFRGKEKRKLLTTELFGPFQIICEYGNNDTEKVLEIMESLPHHLTAAVVSNDT